MTVSQPHITTIQEGDDMSELDYGESPALTTFHQLPERESITIPYTPLPEQPTVTTVHKETPTEQDLSLLLRELGHGMNWLIDENSKRHQSIKDIHQNILTLGEGMM
jgi:hypothetical protein